MGSLNGARVALLEGRMPGELAGLVRRHGGDPVSVPALRERPLEPGPQLATFVEKIIGGRLPIVVCLTGVGVKTLFDQTERLGRLPELLAALRSTTVVCRGQKPSAVLRRYGIPIALSAASPYTTSELLEVIAGLELADAGVGLIHYGERNLALAEALQQRGARVEELLVYEWLLPEDAQPLRRLVEDVVSNQVDAIAFTSQAQIRHLFQVAAELGQTAELTAALNTRIIVASVGPICTAALQELGITPDVVPDNPKMGPMIGALAQFVEGNARRIPGRHDGRGDEGYSSWLQSLLY